MIFIAEVEGRAVAGMDSGDLDEALDFLLPAVEQMTKAMFELEMDYRIDEAAPVTTRPATETEARLMAMSAAKKRPSRSPVVWFFPVPHID